MKCPMCPGKGGILGKLGNRTHYQCRHCGWQWSKTPKARATARTSVPFRPRTVDRGTAVVRRGLTDEGKLAPSLRREGTRVTFDPTPASHALYSRCPPVGAVGTVTTVPFGSTRRTFLPGPGGGLVYVNWDGYGFQGVSALDIALGELTAPPVRRNPGAPSMTLEAFLRLPTKVERRTYRMGNARRTTYTWVYVVLPSGDVVSLGDPWPVRNPPASEVRTAKERAFARHFEARSNPAGTRAKPDATTLAMAHGLCDGWLCTGIAAVEVSTPEGKKRYCRRCAKLLGYTRRARKR